MVEGRAPLTVTAIAELVGGRLVGDGALAVTAIGPLDRAGPDVLSFLASAKYLTAFQASGAGVVLLAEQFADVAGGPARRIVVTDPYRAVQAVALVLYPVALPDRGTHPTVVVGPGASIGVDPSIGPYAVVGRDAQLGARVTLGAHVTIGGGVVVGDDTVIDPGVTIYPGTVIGARVVIKAGAVVGSPGFGFMEGGAVPDRRLHIGRCLISDDVEIGANATVDRGSLDDTVIGEGTKLDNLVHVGHNVRLGRGCLVAAQCGFAGSARLGDGVLLGGHVAINGHTTVGTGARIAGASVVYGDVPAGETWGGHPARPHRETLRQQAALGRLAGISAKLERLVERVGPDA
ncbi:MAG: UDP-3-O-(3-hydroxymyristoyl)glucosamine N-acyltransferase [Gemmatimonadales bacterium]